jgi:putative phosphoesterase
MNIGVSRMLLGVISDVHGHMDMFHKAIDDLGSRADEIVMAGDSMYEYQFCNEIVEEACRLGVRSILGNHEAVVLSKQGERVRNAPHVRQANIDRLSETPWRIEADLGGCKLLMVHGSPFAPHDEYLYSHSKATLRIGELDADIVIVGHSHCAFDVRVDDKLLLNPGSLGEPRDGDARPSYALVDTETRQVEFVRIEV